MIDVRITSLPPRRLLALAHAGNYNGIGKTFERLNMTAAGLGVLSHDAVSLGIYYDDPDVVPVDTLRSHACVEVPASFTNVPDGLELLNLDGGQFAIGVHRGPYEKLHTSYMWLFSQWLPSSGREAANAPCHEIYVNNPMTAAPEDLETHICVPLTANS